MGLSSRQDIRESVIAKRKPHHEYYGILKMEMRIWDL